MVADDINMENQEQSPDEAFDEKMDLHATNALENKVENMSAIV